MTEFFPSNGYEPGMERMDDDRMERAEQLTAEIAHAGDRHDAETAPDAGDAGDTGVRPESNVVHATSPFAPEDIEEGETFEQRDPATLLARAEGERFIH